MMRFFNKNIIILLFLFFAFLSIFFFVFIKKENGDVLKDENHSFLNTKPGSSEEAITEKESYKKDSTENKKIETQELSTDSDKDGLPDWEEEFRGTDPNKKDTDDDGTSDGEEVKLNRNPLVKAPGDELEKQNYSLEKNLESIYENFFDSNIKSSISNSKTNEFLVAKKKINGEERDLKNYGNKIMSVINEFSPDSSKEFSIFNKLIDDPENENNLKNEKEISKKYKILSDKIGVISPPSCCVEVKKHEKISSVYLKMSNNLDAIINGKKDTETFTKNLQNYNSSVLDLRDSLKETAIFFDLKNIEFQQGEPGYLFTQIY